MKEELLKILRHHSEIIWDRDMMVGTMVKSSEFEKVVDDIIEATKKAPDEIDNNEKLKKHKMKQEDLIYRERWFAFLPVKTKDAGWKWFTTVNRVVDERPVQYLGLLPDIRYYFYDDKIND